MSEASRPSDGPPRVASTRTPATASEQAETSPGRGAGWVRPVLIALGYIVFWQIAPRLPTGSIGAVLLSTVVALALVIWFAAAFARDVQRPAALALNAAAAACAVLPLFLLKRPVLPWGLVPLVLGLPQILVVWLAASLGGLLSRLVRAANMIPPIAAVLALVDIWTVLLGGPVQQAMNSQNPTTQAFTHALNVPLGPPHRETTGAAPLEVTIGFADFLFTAFFFAALGRFAPSRHSYLVTLWALVAVLSAYMLVVLMRDWNLPALVPMAVVMIAVHWRRFHYERSEVFALLYAALLLIVVAGLFWYFGRHGAEPMAPRQASMFDLEPQAAGAVVQSS